jgi:hypothetical protein
MFGLDWQRQVEARLGYGRPLPLDTATFHTERHRVQLTLIMLLWAASLVVILSQRSVVVDLGRSNSGDLEWEISGALRYPSWSAIQKCLRQRGRAGGEATCTPWMARAPDSMCGPVQVPPCSLAAPEFISSLPWAACLGRFFESAKYYTTDPVTVCLSFLK